MRKPNASHPVHIPLARAEQDASAQEHTRAPQLTASLGNAAGDAALAGAWMDGIGPLVQLDQVLLQVGLPDALRPFESNERMQALFQATQNESQSHGDLDGPLALRLLRAAMGGEEEVCPAVAERVMSALSGGRSIPEDVRRPFEQIMNLDLSDVRIRVDDQAARGINARAFTVEHMIVFGAGRYAPNTPDGAELLAHELTHVKQWKEGRVHAPAAGQSSLSQPHDPLEREAEQSATAIVSQLDTHAEALNPFSLGEPLDSSQQSVGSFDQAQPEAVLRDTTPAQEVAMGLPAQSEPIGGVTQGFYTLRASPGTGQQNTPIGTLLGERLEVTVYDKSVLGESEWYLIEMHDGAAYTRATRAHAEAIRSGSNEAAKVMLNSRRAWVTSEALTTYVSYAQILIQLRAFDALYPRMSVRDKITMLRQMAHDEALPFDSVIGTGSGATYEGDRPPISSIFQLMQGTKAFQLPGGEVVDFYHFLVGLDALQTDRRKERQTYYGRPIGSSYAAATWSGDIGAGVTDMYLAQDGPTESNLGRNHSGAALRDARRHHYFTSRAPHADLIADIDAWGAYDKVDSAQSLTELVEDTYGPDPAQQTTTDDSMVRASRAQALGRFLSHYGFSSTENLRDQPQRAHFQSEIFLFAKTWLINRQAWSSIIGNAAMLTALWDESGEMAGLFLDWLETQASGLPITITGGGGVGPIPQAPTPDACEPATPARTSFSSTFDIFVRLPKSRVFSVPQGGQVDVFCDNTTFVRPARAPTSSDRYSIILWRGANSNEFLDNMEAEVMFEAGQPSSVTWNGLDGGTYWLEIVRMTEDVNAYEVLQGDIDVEVR